MIRVEAGKGDNSNDGDNGKGKSNGLGQLKITCEKQKDAMPFQKFSRLGRRVDLDDGRSSCVLDSLDGIVAAIMSSPRDSGVKELVWALQNFGQNGATHAEWKETCKTNGILESTFNRRLKDAVAAGLVEKDGDGQGARYRVVKSEALSVSADVKPVS